MNHELTVYLNQTPAGELSVSLDNEMCFTYYSAYLKNKTSIPLSQSLPPQETVYTAKQCRPFFSGILPEAHLRTTIARQLGISEKNDFALLSAIGGECAGAVSLLPTGTTPDALIPDFRVMDEATLVTILKEMHQRPMLAGEDGIRLSLAGAQDKLAVACTNGQIAIPMGAPLAHIY